MHADEPRRYHRQVEKHTGAITVESKEEASHSGEGLPHEGARECRQSQTADESHEHGHKEDYFVCKVLKESNGQSYTGQARTEHCSANANRLKAM